MSEPTDLQDLYLEPQRRLSRYWWLAAGLLALLLLGAGGLGLAIAGGIIPNPIAAATQPTAAPTATPLPRPTDTPAPPVATFSASPWTDGSGPLDLVELTLSVPVQAHVGHEVPPGFRYWRGDLLPTRQSLPSSAIGGLPSSAIEGLAWSGSGPAEVHWFLLREPGTPLPATVEVTVNGRTLALSLQPASPATTSAVLE
jgi:hypothetical protein